MVTTVLKPKVKNKTQRPKSGSKGDGRSRQVFTSVPTDAPARPQARPLSLKELKQALYQKFEVTNTAELRKDGCFQGLTHGLGKFDFRFKATWKTLYRELVGILPDEYNQQGYGCINGINIFNYFRPWQVFELNSKTATAVEIRHAYHRLAKIYHPDIPQTGDRAIFEEIEVMYRSLLFAKRHQKK